MTSPLFRHQVDIAASPEVVFPFLTDGDLITVWMGDHAALDPRPNGEFAVDINGVPVRGRFLEVDPPHRVLLSWGHAGSAELQPGSSTVEIILTPTATGTRLTLEHRDLPPEQVAQHAVGWPHFLGRLGVAATGSDPGPDPFADRPPDASPE